MRPDPGVEQFHALVHKTASMILGTVDADFDDVVQVLYVKCWRAMAAYDPAKSRMTLQRFVFMAMRNQVKDLQRSAVTHAAHRRRRDVSLDAVEITTGFQSRDSFESWAGLVVEDDVAATLDDGLLLPNTLSEQERSVVALLMQDWSQGEVRAQLRIGARDMEKVMRSVRAKLADWRPTQAPAPRADTDSGPTPRSSCSLPELSAAAS